MHGALRSLTHGDIVLFFFNFRILSPSIWARNARCDDYHIPYFEIMPPVCGHRKVARIYQASCANWSKWRMTFIICYRIGFSFDILLISDQIYIHFKITRHVYWYMMDCFRGDTCLSVLQPGK